MASLADTPVEDTEGGVPQGRGTLILGGPGSGKTILGLQTLVNGARLYREPGIFVAFEENSQRIIANAATFGWELPALHEKNLFFLDAQPKLSLIKAGGFDLRGMLAALAAKARQMRARRIVFDSIDVPLALLNNPQLERHEVYRLHDRLLHHRLTTLITAKQNSQATQQGVQTLSELMAFMVDCVVKLKHICVQGVSQRNLRVLKYRGSAFAENKSPFVIGPSGLEVANVLPVPRSPILATTEKISSGIARLNTMLNGGYYRGASVLITGSPGTAKSTLCGTFTEAACHRGERTLFVSFDTDSIEILRNLGSVNIRLRRFVRNDRLRIVSARSAACSAEIHFLHLKNQVHEHGARCLVVDPVSALAKSANGSVTHSLVERHVDWVKVQGITLVCTSLLEKTTPEVETTAIQISTIADTWIHLSYQIRSGERNRALTIIKSRGTAHSNQVRELVLTRSGVTLADVYTADGEVLMGTLRWEKEQAERAEQHLARTEFEHKRIGMVQEEAELEARLGALQRELAARRTGRKLLDRIETKRRSRISAGRARMAKLRGADAAHR